MRREWLMVLLVVGLLMSVGCGTTARASATSEEESERSKALTASGEKYTVQSGDTLMGVSRKLFSGDPQYWDEIVALNDDIRAPDYTIYPGQEIKVPER